MIQNLENRKIGIMISQGIKQYHILSNRVTYITLNQIKLFQTVSNSTKFNHIQLNKVSYITLYQTVPNYIN
jgi:hypothetical protein